MHRFSIARLTAGVIVATFALTACGESREEQLRRELSYENAGKKKGNPLDEVEKVPPHPTRDALKPLLEKVYSGNRLPDVLEADIEAADANRPYELTAGVLSVVRLKNGLNGDQKVRAIIQATAEADGWVPRSKARKNYADHVHKVMRSYGDDQKQAILAAYGRLKLLDFFNSEESKAAIAALPAEVKAPVEALAQTYVQDKEAVWKEWMAVKMYARREVASDEPFKSVLRAIREDLGQEEPKPITWDQAHDAPFQAWAKEINSNEEVFKILTNLKELREQEDFRSDTHTMWVVEGSAKVPEKAKDIKPEKELGFGVHREDLGGGYQEMTFVFSKRLKGNALKRAYLRSHIYRHMFSDFATLATAGSDFKENIVPDKFDPSYAKCGSEAALDAFIASYGGKFPVLAGMSAKMRDEQKILERAVQCILSECRPEIKEPDPNDDMDTQGPAPGSRLGFFQMLARFQTVDVDLNAMRKDPPKTQDVLDAEAFLKANPNKPL